MPDDASADASGRGSVSGVSGLTTPARFRFGVGSVAMLGLHRPPYAEPYYTGFTAGGFGLTVEAGAIFADRFTVMWRGELASSIGSIIGLTGVVFDFAMGDHASFGFGPAFTFWQRLVPLVDSYVLSFFGVSLPLRAQWTFSSRAPGTARRSGWTVSAHLAPGIAVTSPPCFACISGQSSPIAFTAGAGLGYLWW